MATDGKSKSSAAAAMAVEERLVVELPAPNGWVKNFTPGKGETPKRNEITFISPTGELIRNKSQLEKYLRKNLGGPKLSEFDWGTGDILRRSARISYKEKAKAEQTPDQEKQAKRAKKTKLKKALKGEKDESELNVAADAAQDAGNGSVDFEMKEGDGEKETKGDGASESAAKDTVAVDAENQAATQAPINESDSNINLNVIENKNLAEKSFGQEEESKLELGHEQGEASAEKERVDRNTDPENLIQKDTEDKSI